MNEKQSKFQSGTIVRLKSGGPLMTSMGYTEPPTDDETATRYVACVWFPETDSAQWNTRYTPRPEHESFEEDALVEVAT